MHAFSGGAKSFGRISTFIHGLQNPFVQELIFHLLINSREMMGLLLAERSSNVAI